MRFAFVIICISSVLAGCATPYERCTSEATKDLRVVQDLITETEQNIERGYAFEQEVVPSTRFEWCVSRNDRFHLCRDTRFSTRDKPVAIDLEAEREKLQGLREKRVDLAARSQDDISACQQQFPDAER
ncbi:hypothetical protein [Pseudaestuariivita rosea]|uniref:hypothetical protein n=1 Tax=Pseudaestuariivita rosea TaxID=2763263 RepID=UPI001ABA492B|nr:hypothetical protein [Pseudaestuariivita rosea]